MFFSSLPLVVKIVICYMVVINLATFFIYALDKIKSFGNKRRISEKTLWFFALIGGSIGALCAMHMVRHKTKKISFQLVLALIILIQITLIIYLWRTLETQKTIF